VAPTVKPKAPGQAACEEEASQDLRDDLFQAAKEEVASQILQHFFEVEPRNEDLDISSNAARDGTGAPCGRVSINAGATTRVQISAKRGQVLYIGRGFVKRADGSLDLSLVTVAFIKKGIQVGFLPEVNFERRIFLDRDDMFEIVITNGTAGTLVFNYGLEGFARRAGIPVLQPDRKEGRS
jgi:hypothetical protein